MMNIGVIAKLYTRNSLNGTVTKTAIKILYNLLYKIKAILS